MVDVRARHAERVRTRPGRGTAAVGGTHSVFRLGQSAATGSAASPVLPAFLRATSAAAAGRLRPHPYRAPVGPRAPAMRAPGSV